MKLLFGVEEIGAEADKFPAGVGGDSPLLELLDELCRVRGGEEGEGSEVDGVLGFKYGDAMIREGLAELGLLIEAGGAESLYPHLLDEF